MKFVAIDPGNELSGFVTMDEYYNIFNFGKVRNEDLVGYLKTAKYDMMVMEMTLNYGGAGKTVFDTTVWIGRFIQVVVDRAKDYVRIFRATVRSKCVPKKKCKLALGIKLKSTDPIIKFLLKQHLEEYLIKKFGKKRMKNFKNDTWQALALGKTFIIRFFKNGEMTKEDFNK